MIYVAEISANFAGQSTCWIIIVTGAPSSSIRVLKRGQSDFLPVSWPVTSIPCQPGVTSPRLRGFFFIFFLVFLSFIHTLALFPHSQDYPPPRPGYSFLFKLVKYLFLLISCIFSPSLVLSSFLILFPSKL